MAGIRIVAGLIFLPALLLVMALLFASYIGFLQWNHESALSEARFFIIQVLAVPGLLPLFTGGFLLFMAKTWRELWLGAAVCVVLFLLHYAVAVYGGHQAYSVYWILQSIELLLCSGLIWLRSSRRWVFSPTAVQQA